MPAPYSSELVNIVGAASGLAPIWLLDVVALDGTSYHWANIETDVAAIYTGSHPAWLSGLANPPANYDTHYFPWLLRAENFHFSRSMVADTANFAVQNLTGNTLQRDVASMLCASTFEGALFAFREYDLATRNAELEMHGRLTLLGVSESEATFGAEQLFNPSNYDGNPYSVSETCQWLYASKQCGDTSGVPCANSYTTCRQPGRFFGVLNNFTIDLVATEAAISPLVIERRRLI